MLKKKVAILSACISFALGSSVFAANMTVQQYKVDIPENLFVAYDGADKAVFPKGFKTGFGSAIALKSIGKDGAIEFYMLTDRGPNGDGPKYEMNGKTYDSKYFPSPDFQPQIGIGVFKDGKVTVKKTIGLKNADGTKITGLPLSPGLVGATNEIALNDAQRPLGYDDNGLDPEGIAVDKQGNIWVCDEYGPFIAKFDARGTLVKKYAAGNGLPDILKFRTPNRGFEGLTITPSGKVIAMEQSVLDIEGQTSGTAQFTRLIELEPETGKTKTYAYPIDVAAYKSPKDAKLGDIYAVSDTTFLIIEQGKDKNKKMRNLIYKVDLSDAEDISGTLRNGMALEYASDVSDIRMAKKELLVDLRDYGWTVEKAEGLTMLPDHQTIVVVNDNDFGLAVQLQDEEHPNAEIGAYTLHQNGDFTYKNKAANPKINMGRNSENEQEMYLYTIRLPKPLK